MMRKKDEPADRLLLQLSRREILYGGMENGAIRSLKRIPVETGEALLPCLQEFLGPQQSGAGQQFVLVSLDTDRVCLVPADFYDVSYSDSYLALCGVGAADAERIVVTAPRGGVVALVCVDSRMDDYLQHRYGKVDYVHPLQLAATSSGGAPVIEAVLTHGLVHLSASAGRLLFAESLPCRTEADLLYALDRVRRLYPQYRFRISLSGAGADRLYGEVARYFRPVSVGRAAVPRRIVSREERSAFIPLIRMSHANY